MTGFRITNRAGEVEREALPWRRQAGCVGVDPETFYDTDPRYRLNAVADAKKVCAGCPVRQACLAEVMATERPGQRYGVWAGLAPTERQALHVRRLRAGVA